MFHLPISLRDAIVDLTLPPLTTTTTTTTNSSYYSGCHSHFDGGRSITRYNPPRHRRNHHHPQRYWNDRTKIVSSSSIKSSNKPMSIIRLLSQPRIVGAAIPTTTSSSSSHAFFQHSGAGRDVWPLSSFFAEGGRLGGLEMPSKEGISCMDLDRGNHANPSSGSPPRYLLVGSGGGDCSIALYDLSCFGSDSYLNNSSSSQNYSNNNNSSSLRKHCSNEQSLWTHRPIARSLRHYNPLSSGDVQDNIVNGIPSGHRHPLRGVHWYPGEFDNMMMRSKYSL
jgi:hypothetical protein